VLLREMVDGARRQVVLRLGDDLDRVPAQAALEAAEVVWLLLEHADRHHDDATVVVAVGLERDELRVTLADDACATGCAERRRCDVVAGPLGGVRLSWSTPLGQARPAATGQSANSSTSSTGRRGVVGTSSRLIGGQPSRTTS
jgi:hypothetical protein